MLCFVRVVVLCCVGRVGMVVACGVWWCGVSVGLVRLDGYWSVWIAV